MAPTNKSITTFLNVDLDICVRIGLETLLQSMAPFVIVLNRSDSTASVELNESYSSLEETVARFVELIHSLPVRAREVWDRCEWRRLNVGIQAGVEPHSSAFSERALSSLAEARFEFVFTVYAPKT